MATGTKRPGHEVADAVADYLDVIGEVPLLTTAEEVRLGKAVADGREARERLESGDVRPSDRPSLEETISAGEVARTSMIRANLRLVVSLVRRHGAPHVPVLDLIQEGNIGLMRAVEKFDHRLGFKFSTYATWWIRQAISRAIPDHRTIRVPPQSYDQLNRCRKVRDEIEESTGTTCGVREIAEQVGLPERRVRDLMRADAPPLTIHVGADSFMDLATDFDADPWIAVHNEDVRQRIGVALANLTDEQLAVVRLRYGFDEAPCSLLQTAKRLGLNKVAVVRIERAALECLRETRFVSSLALPESA